MTYSSSVAMNRRRQIRRHQNTVALALPRTLGPISNSIILIILFCLIGLLYLTQVTRTNSYGYTINELQQRQSKLKTEQADLQVASARLQSLEKVSSSAAAKRLVSVGPTGTLR